MTHAVEMSTLPKTVQNGVTEVKGRGLGTRQANNKNRITAFLFIKTKTRMSKREKLKTTVDAKTEKPVILSASTEKPISKVTKTAKPNN